MAEVPQPARELDEASLQRVAAARALAPGSHIHICGICGTGTAAVLSLLKQLGFRVTGSDKAFYPPMGELVRSQADRVYEGFAASHLDERPDLVVIGNALSATNPEVQEVFARDLPYASMPEIFSALLIGEREYCQHSVVVAGTHGKTTTTAAIATVLDVAGRRPGYFIGGVPSNLPSNIRPVSRELSSQNRVVVLEGDEYDSAFFAKYSKFHSYRPDIAVLTSLEFDHADIYSSIEEIEIEFTRFAKRLPANGLLLVCDQSERLDALVEQWRSGSEVAATIVRYGLKPESPYRLVSREPWRYQDIPEKRFGQRLTVKLAGTEINLTTPLTGLHNALNLTAAAAVARRLGVGVDELTAGVRRFTGVLRRQQVLFAADGITVIEDFAHHPSAVKATLEGLRESYPRRRILAVFEPRSNTSRRGYFQKEYESCFQAADAAYLLEVKDAGGYSNTGSDFTPLDVGEIIASVKRSGREAQSFGSVAALRTHLVDQARSGDLIVLMSNGDFGGLPGTLVQAMEEKH
ncbi:MAG: hypothetical protein KDD69_08210 [Bdellovibrionales bacterium]|nr:hypothetical protein [Bdellovibrionales bacterium]